MEVDHKSCEMKADELDPEANDDTFVEGKEGEEAIVDDSNDFLKQ